MAREESMTKAEIIEFLKPFADDVEIAPLADGYYFRPKYELKDGVGCIKLEIIKDKFFRKGESQ